MAGRLLLAYPLHLCCGALTAVQLIRRNLQATTDATGAAAEGDSGSDRERLHWGWVLVPAVITHGTYDSVLFVLATVMPGTPGTSEDQVPVSEMGFWELLEQLVLLPVGWIYLAVPLFWMRRKLAKADLPGLYAGAVASRASATEMDGQVREHQMREMPGFGDPP
jgi:hypothetical protein